MVVPDFKTPRSDTGPAKLAKPEERTRTRTEVASDDDVCPVGVATNRGGKNNQEDAYFVGGRPPMRMTLNGYTGPFEGCFGIFDGHGGDRASRYTAEHVFARIDDNFQATHDIETAISVGVQKLDEEFCGIARNTQRLFMTRTANIAEAPNGVAQKMGVEDGSTCLVAIIRDGVVFVGNVGDSRAIIATKKGKAIALSIDQKPDHKDERERLEAKGAVVTGPPILAKIMWPMTKFLDCPRVNGALAMSRSIGDISLKKYITSEPEIKTHLITPDDRYLIMATDGLWDVMSNSAAAKMAAKCPDAQSAADAILKYALDHRTEDNTTVLVADLASYK